MPEPSDSNSSGNTDVDEKLPTVSCSRCNKSWQLEFELDQLKAGNQALEQFALDHQRHTGHFPDDITPWLVDCRQCPSNETYLAEQPARRWATTHHRHTGHQVELNPPRNDPTIIGD